MTIRDLKRSLLDASDVLRHVSGRGLLRAAARRGRKVLNVPSARGNEGDASDSEIRDATEVAQNLRGLGRRLEAAALDERGKVDYAALRGSEHRRALERAAGELREVDPTQLERDAERIAFWMNVYNVLAIHGVIALELTRSVMEDPGFFSRVAYRVGSQEYSLDEIENGVLRGNAPHPVSGEPPFGEDDPRRATSPSRVDPRIHAALVCASESCPAVRFYEPDALEEQLEAASRAYVNAEVAIDDATRTLILPLAFRYYASDFGGEPGLRDFIAHHADGHLRRRLTRAADYALDYARYDWALNQS